MQVVLKDGQVVTLPESEHVSLKSLQLLIADNPLGDMAVEGRRGYLTWSDIDLEATKKLHQAAAQGT